MVQDDRNFLKTLPVFKLVELGLSEYALSVVTEYAPIEVTTCRRCHGWGCQPGPCSETPMESSDEKLHIGTSLDGDLPLPTIRES